MNQQMDSFNPPFFNQPGLQLGSTASPAHAHAHAHAHSQSQSQSQAQPTPALGQPQAQQQAHFQFHGASTMPGGASMMQQSPRVSQSFQTPFAHLSRTTTISPPRHVSPYAAATQHHQLSTPEHSQPMAAPVSLPSHGAPAQQKVQTPTKPPQQPPSSPGTQARDHERISLLLEVNKELLIEVMKFKEQGAKAAEGFKDPAETKMYMNDVMRRLQANLSYLATTYERKPNPFPGPAIMSVPSSPPFPAGLVEMYTKLQSLFPGWTGAPLNPAMGNAAQGAQGGPAAAAAQQQQQQQQQHVQHQMQIQQQQRQQQLQALQQQHQQMAQGSPGGQPQGSFG